MLWTPTTVFYRGRGILLTVQYLKLLQNIKLFKYSFNTKFQANLFHKDLHDFRKRFVHRIAGDYLLIYVLTWQRLIHSIFCLRALSRRITKTRLFKYTENFTSKNRKFSDKKLWYFSYFCPRHYTVLTTTHNLCFWAEIRKIMYTSANPSFTI